MLQLLVKEDGGSSSGGRKAYEVGKSRVYFMSGALESLEERRVKMLGQRAAVIQR